MFYKGRQFDCFVVILCIVGLLCKKNGDIEPELKSCEACGYERDNCISNTDEVVTSTALAIASVSSIGAAE